MKKMLCKWKKLIKDIVQATLLLPPTE